jgi:hypothetical protein
MWEMRPIADSISLRPPEMPCALALFSYRRPIHYRSSDLSVKGFVSPTN